MWMVIIFLNFQSNKVIHKVARHFVWAVKSHLLSKLGEWAIRSYLNVRGSSVKYLMPTEISKDVGGHDK